MQSFAKKHDFNEVFDAQRVFRLILVAMSNPGKVVNVGEFIKKLYGPHPELLAVALTLLDNEVSFCACGDKALGGEIASLTLSREEEPEKADFLFVGDPAKLPEVLPRAKCGTLRDPHKSATIIVNDMSFPSFPLRIWGPGIADSALLLAGKFTKIALALRDAQHFEYPQGVDLLFVSGEGDLFALPRLTSWEEG